MNTVTFNSIVDVLVAEFDLAPSAIRPDSTLAELGFDSLSRRELVHAVEDAFRLAIPPYRLDLRDGGMALRTLCEQVDALQREPAPARNPAGLQVKKNFALP